MLSFGDSGGPLIQKGKSAGDDLVIGTVSWGRDCAAQDFAGVYARMSFFYDWIVETACDVSNDHPFDCTLKAQLEAPSGAPTREASTAPTQGEPRANFVAWSPRTPLGRCEGDCDRDSQCRGTLVCYEGSSETVPGCQGERQDRVADYCVRPEDLRPQRPSA